MISKLVFDSSSIESSRGLYFYPTTYASQLTSFLRKENKRLKKENSFLLFNHKAYESEFMNSRIIRSDICDISKKGQKKDRPKLIVLIEAITKHQRKLGPSDYNHASITYDLDYLALDDIIKVTECVEAFDLTQFMNLNLL